MEEATSEDIPQEIKDRYQYARLQMLCELSNINISRARAEADPRERVNHMIRATGPLDRARLLDPTDQLVHLTNGHLLFASVSPLPMHAVPMQHSPDEGNRLLAKAHLLDPTDQLMHLTEKAGIQSEVEKAKSELKMAMKASTASRASVAATLALANILFQQKRFSEAHRYFCQVRLGAASLNERACDSTGDTSTCRSLAVRVYAAYSHISAPSLGCCDVSV